MIVSAHRSHLGLSCSLRSCLSQPVKSSVLSALLACQPCEAPEGHGVYGIKGGEHNSTFSSGKGTQGQAWYPVTMLLEEG